MNDTIKCKLVLESVKQGQITIHSSYKTLHSLAILLFNAKHIEGFAIYSNSDELIELR